MADYSRRTKSTNAHLGNLTGAKFVNIDGSSTPTTVVSTTSGAFLLRVILNTNGATVGLRTGSRQIGTIATDAPEGSFNYGIYCENGIQVDTSGACSATVVFSR